MSLRPNLTTSTIWRDFDLSVVTERFRLKSPYGSKAEELEREARRFLWISAKTQRPLVPSELVDQYWHALILSTSLYRDYCEHAFGFFIEHTNGIPVSSPEALETHIKAYEETLQIYETEFQIPAPSEFWPDLRNRVEKRLDVCKKPYRLHLETTNHCNLRCEHCYPESSSAEPHHSRELIDRTLHEAARLGVRKITLTGGEVLTRPDWKEIFLKSLDICDNLYFITNGLLLTQKKLEWLAKERAARSLRGWRRSIFSNSPVEIGVAISLDGLAGNALVRKNDAGVGVSAKQVIDRIALAVQYGLHVTVNTTITNKVSAQELPEMYDILSRIGIDRWQIDQAYLAGRFKQSELSASKLAWLEDAKAGYKYIIKNYLKEYPKIPNWRLEIVQVFRYDNLFYGFSPAASLNEHPCSYHFGSMIVEQGDRIRFCPSLRDGGLQSISVAGSVEAAYGCSEFKDFLSKSIKDLPCQDCRYGKLFHGGCRANSYAYLGRMWDADPICCILAPFVEEEILPLLPKSLQDSFRASLQGGPRPGDPDHLPTKQQLRRIVPIQMIP
ncbi:radical SAM protein [Cupriavidus alkaliphilus]|uniref:radical SAM protein n=1 Tax=Cupriavidus alkaliphilus TaxID=942866 RepID=UPI000DC1FD47|nr:radical SAM protein [Cupriavidus alkaliphilus]RAS12194.1 radical SAM protein with 4Fe4S-binding SPASM domain [Cupriavidus alkaliphilus]